MKKYKTFHVIWQYLKDDKLKVFIWILLVFSSYIPPLLIAFLFGKAAEMLIHNQYNMFLLNLIIWLGLDIVFYAILMIPRDRLYKYLEIKFMKNVSKDLYHKLDNMPAIAFEEIGVGELVNRIYTDPERVMSLFFMLIRMICRSFVVVVVIFISFKVSFFMGCEVLLFGVIMGLISAHYFPKIKNTHKEIKADYDLYVKKITENITGIREIKSLGIKHNIEKDINNDLDNLFLKVKQINKFEVNYYGLNNFIYFVLKGAILATTGYLFIKGHVAYAIFMVMENYIGRIDGVVESISEFGVNYNKVTVSLQRIDEIINNKLYKDELFGNVELKDTKGLIEFKGVDFKYREEEELVLNNLNLKIEPNKKIAVVGRSGNGKSTLFNLLLRYFDTTKGQILIDGVDIKDLTEKSLRENISVIRQAPFLFNLSIIDNFRLVVDNVDLKKVREVCKKAYIDDYIMSLPNGYDTIIGEGGVNLSGGQKQRLAIARTLLLNTKIILFDEATSALDNESQEYIKKTIDNLVKDHTVVIVAHRLSTIIDADTINVIDKGKLADYGTHEELLKNSKVYQKLYNSESSNQT